MLLKKNLDISLLYIINLIFQFSSFCLFSSKWHWAAQVGEDGLTGEQWDEDLRRI